MSVGALHALALLLAAAAGAKLIGPGRSVRALTLARLPSSTGLVRLLGLAEGATAIVVLVVGGSLPALTLAAFHLGFAGFVARLRAAAGPDASCGCFGGAEAPAERIHVAVNLAAAAVAALAAVTGAPTLIATLADQPALGLPYLALVVVAAQAVRLTLTALADLVAAQRQLA